MILRISVRVLRVKVTVVLFFVVNSAILFVVVIRIITVSVRSGSIMSR